MKVVLNLDYGGFSLSKAAYEYLGLPWDGYGYASFERNDPKLVECVETLGTQKASGLFADLGIAEIPDDVDWEIEEYDGKERVVEVPRTWYGKPVVAD